MRVGQTHSLRYMTHAHTNPQQTPACPDTSDTCQLSEQTESRPPASQPFAAQQESAGAVPASQVHRVAAVPSRTLPPKKTFFCQPQRLNFTGVLEPKPTAREIGAAGSACIFRPALLKRKKRGTDFFRGMGKNRQPKGGMGGRYTATTQGF